MKRAILTAIILCLFAAPAFSGDWNDWRWDSSDYAREAIALGLTVIDWGQTQDISNHQKTKELNPILGGRPSNGAVNTYFACVMVLHPLISAALPKGPRAAWQYVYIGVEATAVGSNWRSGLRVTF